MANKIARMLCGIKCPDSMFAGCGKNEQDVFVLTNKSHVSNLSAARARRRGRAERRAMARLRAGQYVKRVGVK